MNATGKPRVLLVEDEALVAMMIQDTLTEFGFQVIGPCRTASEALAAARNSHFDAAVLDINLGDGLVYTVAEILGKRGVPFVFVTGYDADSVDARFSGVPVLQKPIERDMLQQDLPARRGIRRPPPTSRGPSAQRLIAIRSCRRRGLPAPSAAS